jgi:hypothetical protein
MMALTNLLQDGQTQRIRRLISGACWPPVPHSYLLTLTVAEPLGATSK